jgi:hypothetical protein
MTLSRSQDEESESKEDKEWKKHEESNDVHTN